MLVCLLPVRNGEEDLPGFLETVGRFADALVALDDGSTDRTREILRASPLVDVLLTNPARETAAGWDDSANRNLLLQAAADLDPDWILSLDTDERIPPDDARALRRFVDTDALPGCAYGLLHYRMWEDAHDPAARYVYRLFAFEPGQSFPDQRLHFDPIPTSIPRERWLRTTIRLQHLAAATEGRRLARLAKYREADPDSDYPVDFGRLDRPPGPELAVWKERPPDLPVLAGAGASQADLLPSQEGRPAGRHLLVCLLPVRNGEEDLPGYLGSVGRFADAVVALDDGSTDRTREILQEHALVKVLLANPRRETYAGWDDSENRNRLLEAAAALDPAWIVSVDADERIDPDDAAALRAFVEREGRPDLAYQFRVHRMVGDLQHYDRAELWVCRLFAFRPGQRFASRSLHFVPIPESIRPGRWVRTTLRLQHLAGLTEERRRDRFAKYMEADPDGAFQPDYGHLLDRPGVVRPWEPRGPGTPVIPAGAAEDLDLEGPVLSAVVIAHGDERTIERAVGSVVRQESPESFEVIVAVSGRDRTADVVRERFPDVTVVELPGTALPGAARNAGLRLAKGDWVSFPGSHVELAPGSLAARIRAHEIGYPMVTGSMRNATHTPAGWASYFLDHSGSLPGRPSGELVGPPAHCSYARDFLLQLGGFPEDVRAGEDTAVNLELARRGYRAYRSADIVLAHHSPCTTVPRLLAHHFERGRALGRLLVEQRRRSRSALRPAAGRGLLVGYVPRRLRKTAANVDRWGGELRLVHRRVRPLIALGAGAAWAGACLEVIARGGVSTVLSTGTTFLLAGLDEKPRDPIGRADVLLLCRVLPGAEVRLVAVPRDLLVDIAGRGPGRLNESYFWGARGENDPSKGLSLLRRTVERAFGIRVDAAVAVDFEGFRSVIDAVGGIDVHVGRAIEDRHRSPVWAGTRFAAGRHHLDGRRALEYARTRHADGDAARRSRHLEIVVAVLRRMRSTAMALAAARAALRTVHVWPGPKAWFLLAAAGLRARRGSIRTSVLGAPDVRSVRVDGRWVHLGDPMAVSAAVRRELGLAEATPAVSPGRGRTPAWTSPRRPRRSVGAGPGTGRFPRRSPGTSRSAR